jgi:hypothetical protein
MNLKSFQKSKAYLSKINLKHQFKNLLYHLVNNPNHLSHAKIKQTKASAKLQNPFLKMNQNGHLLDKI